MFLGYIYPTYILTASLGCISQSAVYLYTSVGAGLALVCNRFAKPHPAQETVLSVELLSVERRKV